MRIWRVVAVLGLVLAPAVLGAATWPEPVQGDFTMADFRFAGGGRMPALKIHYRTLGTLTRDAAGHARNAVLILHGTGGTGAGFLSANFAGELFGPGQLLDAARYFIILPDAIGTGGSTKPSDGLHAGFPHYGYQDMIEAQHRLVTEHLAVDHLRLILGTSMGAMHAWMWGERWPSMMDGLMPLASAPTAIAGRNRVMRAMIIDAIRTDPEWKNGDYTAQPRGLIGALNILLMMTSAPLQWHKTAPTSAAADAWWHDQIKARMAATDANDLLYQFEASADYDPSPDLEKITAPLLAINSADDVVNPPELGLMEKLIPRVRRGRYVLVPVSDLTRGHSTHSWPVVWGGYLKDFLALIGSH